MNFFAGPNFEHESKSRPSPLLETGFKECPASNQLGFWAGMGKWIAFWTTSKNETPTHQNFK